MSKWNEKVFGEVATTSKGRLTLQSESKEQDFLPLINTDAVNGKPTLFGNSKGAILCEEDDVLMLWDGERSGLVAIGYSGVVGSTFAKLTPYDFIDSKYLFYFLDSKFYWIQGQRTGTGVPHVPKNLDKILWVKYPENKTEQQQIAKILSTADAVIEKTQAAIAKYKAIKQGMLHDLFTRGIDLNTNKLRPRYQDAPELYKEGKLGWIPREWEDKELGDVGEVRMCRRVFNYETSDQGDIPFYKIRTFGKQPDAYISKELYDSYRQQFSFPNKGDILISAAGTIGRTIIYDGTPSYFQDSNIVWIENNGHLITNEYLYQVFQIVEYKTEGGTIQRLYNSILKSALFPCPPKPEQQLITERLNAIDNKLQTEQTYLQKMQSLKKGLMEDLLSGKKQVKVAEEVLTQSEN